MLWYPSIYCVAPLLFAIVDEGSLKSKVMEISKRELRFPHCASPLMEIFIEICHFFNLLKTKEKTNEVLFFSPLFQMEIPIRIYTVCLSVCPSLSLSLFDCACVCLCVVCLCVCLFVSS